MQYQIMELQYSYFNLISFFLFIFVLYKVINGRKKSSQLDSKPNLPPGPWKLPFLGNFHNLMSGALPHHIFRDLARKHGPLMLLKLGEINTVIVSSPAMAKEVMKTHDLAFANRPLSPASRVIFYEADIAFSPYGEYWRQMRKVCVSKLFSAKSVGSFMPIRLDEGYRLVASLRESAGKSINLSDKISLYTSSVVSRAAFGTGNKAGNKFAHLVEEVSLLAGAFDPADLFPSYKILHFLGGPMSKLLKVHRNLDMVLEDMINEHVKNHEMSKKANGEDGEEDIIDILLKIKDSTDLQFPFTIRNMKGIIFDIFGAGTEPTSSTVDWAMAELMRNPDVMAKAQNEVRQAAKGKKTISEADTQELKYLKAVIKEVVRLHPPVMLIPRECRETCKIDGYDIPEKTRVLINSWAIGRDENSWKDPESFIPERFIENSSIDFTGNYYEFIPFGGGRRTCLGMTFGLALVDLVLALLLFHFNWELPPGVGPNDVDMTETIGMASRRKNSLEVIPTLYDPAIDT